MVGESDYIKPYVTIIKDPRKQHYVDILDRYRRFVDDPAGYVDEPTCQEPTYDTFVEMSGLVGSVGHRSIKVL